MHILSYKMIKDSGKKLHTIENQLYIIGLVFSIIFAIAVVALKIILPEDFEMRTCVFFKATGYYCPGCGGTRAFLSMLKGKFITSFVYHPLVMYAVCIYVIFMVSHTIERLERCYYRRKAVVKEKLFITGLKFRPWYLYGAVAIIFINVTLKNILIHIGLWTKL